MIGPNVALCFLLLELSSVSPLVLPCKHHGCFAREPEKRAAARAGQHGSGFDPSPADVTCLRRLRRPPTSGSCCTCASRVAGAEGPSAKCQKAHAAAWRSGSQGCFACSHRPWASSRLPVGPQCPVALAQVAGPLRKGQACAVRRISESQTWRQAETPRFPPGVRGLQLLVWGFLAPGKPQCLH